MDFTQLANLGEFVGGIAVAVTLIYLAFELHRSRSESQAASVDALVSRLDAFNADFHNNAELCEISMRGNDNPEDLGPVESGPAKEQLPRKMFETRCPSLGQTRTSLQSSLTGKA